MMGKEKKKLKEVQSYCIHLLLQVPRQLPLQAF